MSEYTILWTPPSGSAVQLSGESYYTVLEGDSGWFMPNVNLLLDYYQMHAVVSRVRMDPRIISMPVVIQATSQAQMDQAVDALCKAFNPTSGLEGVLKITRHDGVFREIKGIYMTGLEGVRSRENYYQLWFKADITLKCINPAWYNPTAKTYAYTQSNPPNFFPILPAILGAGQIFGDTQVVNDGSLEAWPIWSITGPGNNAIVENVTTGEKITLVVTILAGEVLVIDTRPGVKTIKIGSQNKFGTMTASSILWSLIAGSQTVKVTLTGATSASRVDLSFNERYLSL